MRVETKYPPPSSKVEASKFRKRTKYRTNFHVTDAHTKRDVEKVTNKQKRPLSSARSASLPPAAVFPFRVSEAGCEDDTKQRHDEEEKRADTRRAALTREVSEVDVAAAETGYVRALGLVRAWRLGPFPRRRASPPRPRPRARRDGILPVRRGERPERGGRGRDVRGRHAQRPDAAGRALRHRAEPPVGTHHGASAGGTAPRVPSSRRPAPRRVVVLVSARASFLFRSGARILVSHSNATGRRTVFSRIRRRRVSTFPDPRALTRSPPPKPERNPNETRTKPERLERA